MQYELTGEKKQKKHLPSIYNAALNNKAGWAIAANAVIQHRLPRLRAPKDPASITEHIKLVGDFTMEFAVWLCKFAKSISAVWGTPEYRQARTQSNTPIETWGLRHHGEWRGHLV